MTNVTDNGSASCELALERPERDTLVVRLTGSWTLRNKCPSADRVLKEIPSGASVAHIAFDAADLRDWDSGFLIFLTRITEAAKRDGVAVDMEGLPEGACKLLTLAATVPEKRGTGKGAHKASFLSRVGEETIDFFRSAREIIDFVGEVFIAFSRLAAGKARFRGSDLARIFQDCGIEALPIVSLISLLVGLILAFVGAVQLMLFGAQIYVANLVGIAMVRVMGAVMTGIIMAGRTGAAFAAQLGTMQVNEEVDAFKAVGISPMEFLVLPRVIGLTLMMPLLCLYADFMGILGGLIVGVGMLDLSAAEYYQQTKDAVGLDNLWIGLFQSIVFGVLVAVAGCLRGMQCGRSASAVGDAATSAVVTGIVSIVVATAIITVMCNALGI
jgi:phospholipid/cholesterol/gamma-HCH transport system permease protein